jgi:transposase
MEARQARAGQGYDAASFQLDWEHKTATCPQGKTSRKWKRALDHHHLEIIHVEFGKADCLACPARALCTTAASNPRQLSLRPQAQYEAIQAARRRQTTQEFKEEYALRAGVEGTLSPSAFAPLACDRHATWVKPKRTYNMSSSPPLSM